MMTSHEIRNAIRLLHPAPVRLSVRGGVQAGPEPATSGRFLLRLPFEEGEL